MRRSHHPVIAVGAAVAFGLLWVSMTLRFDLIFHFHPALPGLALGWFLREGKRNLVRDSLTVVAAAALVVVSAGLYLDARDAPLDPWWFTILIMGVGIIGGIALVRWREKIDAEA